MQTHARWRRQELVRQERMDKWVVVMVVMTVLLTLYLIAVTATTPASHYTIY